MLLNEAQAQNRRVEEQAAIIQSQEQKIDSQQRELEQMQKRLSDLETLIAGQTTTSQTLAPQSGYRSGETR